MNTNIILSGVGGQGILSIAAVIGKAALNNDLYIKQSEVQDRKSTRLNSSHL